MSIGNTFFSLFSGVSIWTPSSLYFPGVHLDTFFSLLPGVHLDTFFSLFPTLFGHLLLFTSWASIWTPSSLLPPVSIWTPSFLSLGCSIWTPSSLYFLGVQDTLFFLFPGVHLDTFFSSPPGCPLDTFFSLLLGCPFGHLLPLYFLGVHLAISLWVSIWTPSSLHSWVSIWTPSSLYFLGVHLDTFFSLLLGRFIADLGCPLDTSSLSPRVSIGTPSSLYFLGVHWDTLSLRFFQSFFCFR